MYGGQRDWLPGSERGRKVDHRGKAVPSQRGLDTVAEGKPKTFSLGRGQRLGLAAALLGDPHPLILDEPANGLDPQGIQWMRSLLKGLASQGRADGREPRPPTLARCLSS